MDPPGNNKEPTGSATLLQTPLAQKKLQLRNSFSRIKVFLSEEGNDGNNKQKNWKYIIKWVVGWEGAEVVYKENASATNLLRISSRLLNSLAVPAMPYLECGLQKLCLDLLASQEISLVFTTVGESLVGKSSACKKEASTLLLVSRAGLSLRNQNCSVIHSLCLCSDDQSWRLSQTPGSPRRKELINSCTIFFISYTTPSHLKQVIQK